MLFSFAGAACSAIYLFPYKSAAQAVPPSVLALSLLIGAALLNSALLAWERRLPRARSFGTARVFWQTTIALALLTVTGNLCCARALAQLDPAVTSVLLRTEVVFVGVLGACLLAERLTAWLVVGTAVALAGLLVMRWPLVLDGSSAGAAWALAAAASFGSMQVVTRRAIRGLCPVTVNAVRLWLAVVVLLFVPGLARSTIAAGSTVWMSVGAAAFFGPFLGRLFIMQSLRTLPAARSALLLLIAPVLAFAIGYVGYGMRVTLREALGGSLMLLGIGLPSVANAYGRRWNAKRLQARL